MFAGIQEVLMIYKPQDVPRPQHFVGDGHWCASPAHYKFRTTHRISPRVVGFDPPHSQPGLGMVCSMKAAEHG